MLLTVDNVVTVSAVVTKLFEAGSARLAWEWNALNLVRMALTATTAFYVFSAFRKLDRR